MTFPPLSRSRSLIILAAAILVVAVGSLLFLRRNHVHPLLAEPTLLLEHVSGKSVYYNAAARDWLGGRRPELLTAEDKDPKSSRVRGFIQAVQNPKLFRQLDRQYRFDSLVLLGDPSQYRPLLEHLLESKDFTISYLDHTGIIYSRAASDWSPDRISELRETLKQRGVKDEVPFLAQTALKLIAVRQLAPANKLIEEAKTLNEPSAELYGAAAQYRLAMGQWAEALGEADKALALDDSFQPAWAVKAQALYATKHFVDAFEYSQRLVEKNPDDPGMLFYHAKIAHEARGFQDEIRVMKHLIDLAEKEQRPTSGYRMYLAQAYAADSQGEPAIKQFQLAMQDPELPKDQRQFAQESTARIKSRLGLR